MAGILCRQSRPPSTLFLPTPKTFRSNFSKPICPNLLPDLLRTTIRDSMPQQARYSSEQDLQQPELWQSQRSKGFQIVVAATKNWGIGKDGHLPWKLPKELSFFKKITTTTADPGRKNAVIMGRKTWESIPDRFRPLPGRVNVVLSRSGKVESRLSSDVVISKGFEAAIELLRSPPLSSAIETIFVIGGAEVFSEALGSPLCDAVHFTSIETNFDCDTFMPPINNEIFHIWYASAPAMENATRYSFMTFIRNGSTPDDNENLEIHGVLPKFVVEKHEEFQYLNLVQDVIENGNIKDDRTGTGTISKFGCQMRFNLRHSFPLLTTKRVFWRGIVEELLWFISGSTNAKVLQAKGIRIWDGNASREYLDSIGLKDRKEGDLGPVYGFQWRHFGAKYIDKDTDYTGQGVDQLADVIHKIRNSPNDRRILLSAWNPADIHLMALPPCHMFAQFYVANGELSCQMYQRSCDLGLGVPFNIASYSLLTCMIAHVCDLTPGDFVHVLGDAHVYKNHAEPLMQQLKNTPKPFPRLKINTSNKDIDSFIARDFELVGYSSHSRIAMKMAV